MPKGDAVFKLDLSQLEPKLDALESADRKPLLAAFGGLTVRSIQSTFREGGSPAGSWPARKSGGSWPLLRKTTRLFGSISFAVRDESTVEVGTNVVYAAAQHFGFEYPRVKIVPRNKKALRWIGANGKPIFSRGHVIPKRTLPARPFIILRPEDPEMLARAGADFYQRVMEQTGGPAAFEGA
jgi:phage gpG-like protein